MKRIRSPFPIWTVVSPAPGTFTPERKREAIRNGCSYFDEAKNLFFMQRVLGMLPICADETGDMRVKLFTLPVLYTVIVQALLLSLDGYALVKNFEFLQKDIGFDDKIMIYGSILYMGFHLVCFCLFFESRKFAAYAMDWKKFQMKYYKLTGKWIVAKLRRLAIVILTIVTISSVFIVLLVRHMLMEVGARYEQAITNFFLFTQLFTGVYYWWMIAMFVSIWCVSTNAIRQAAQSLLGDLKNTQLRNKSISEIYSTWLDLRNLTQDLGTTLGFTYLLYLTYMSMMLMASAYSLISSLAAPDEESRFAFMIFVFATATAYALVADCAHRVSYEVGDKFNQTLFTLLHLETNPVIEKEIRWFLQTIAISPPVMTLSGYLTLNRALNISVLGTTVTYVIIVLQFKISSVKGIENLKGDNKTLPMG